MEFFNWVHAVHLKVLPLNEESDIRVWTDLNPDDGSALLELHAPLVYGVGSDSSHSVSYSDLFESVVRFHTTPSPDELSLSVKSSKFELRVETAPGVRFEYERDNRNAPTAPYSSFRGGWPVEPRADEKLFRSEESTEEGKD